MSIAEILLDTLLISLEGEVSSLKGDEPTVYGLNSKFYPDFVDRYRTAKATANVSMMAAMQLEAKEIYRTEYLEVIPGYGWMEAQFPALLALLFFGRVHGVGYRAYVKAIQGYLNNKVGVSPRLAEDGLLGPRTLNAIKQLTQLQQGDLLKHLNSTPIKNGLKDIRVKAVIAGGTRGVDNGIRNRVDKELKVAQVLHMDSEATIIASREAPALVIRRGRSASVPAGNGAKGAPITIGLV